LSRRPRWCTLFMAGALCGARKQSVKKNQHLYKRDPGWIEHGPGRARPTADDDPKAPTWCKGSVKAKLTTTRYAGRHFFE